MIDWLHVLLLVTTCVGCLPTLWRHKQVSDLRRNYDETWDDYKEVSRQLHQAQAVIRRTQEHSAQLNMLINKHLNQP